jgi:hypothetical protein
MNIVNKHHDNIRVFKDAIAKIRIALNKNASAASAASPCGNGEDVMTKELLERELNQNKRGMLMEAYRLKLEQYRNDKIAVAAYIEKYAAQSQDNVLFFEQNHHFKLAYLKYQLEEHSKGWNGEFDVSRLMEFVENRLIKTRNSLELLHRVKVYEPTNRYYFEFLGEDGKKQYMLYKAYLFMAFNRLHHTKVLEIIKKYEETVYKILVELQKRYSIKKEITYLEESNKDRLTGTDLYALAKSLGYPFIKYHSIDTDGYYESLNEFDELGFPCLIKNDEPLSVDEPIDY